MKKVVKEVIIFITMVLFGYLFGKFVFNSSLSFPAAIVGYGVTRFVYWYPKWRKKNVK